MQSSGKQIPGKQSSGRPASGKQTSDQQRSGGQIPDRQGSGGQITKELSSGAQSSTLRIPVGELSYHVQIRGEGKPVIVLHGFSENLSTWDALDLPGYQLVLVDWVGHGQSDKPQSRKEYHWKAMIGHLHRAVAYLGLSRYALLGYSMGGRMALVYTLTYPEEVDKLMLESASYGECGALKRRQRRRSDGELGRKIRENGIEWFNEYWSGLRLFNTQAELPEAVTAAIRERRLGNETYALANSLWGSGQGKFPCLKDKLRQLTMPVLYLNGEYDSKYSAAGAEFSRLNPLIKRQVIAGAGHNIHIEKPEDFRQAVQAFLDR